MSKDYKKIGNKYALKGQGVKTVVEQYKTLINELMDKLPQNIPSPVTIEDVVLPWTEDGSEYEKITIDKKNGEITVKTQAHLSDTTYDEPIKNIMNSLDAGQATEARAKTIFNGLVKYFQNYKEN